MSLESVARAIAHKVEEIVWDTMRRLEIGRVKHEDDLTGDLLGAIRQGVRDFQTGGVRWDSSILTHRRSGEEGKYGADFMIHVELDTPEQKYSKGVLVQAKRIGPGEFMSEKAHTELIDQTEKMLNVTAESFVFVYDAAGMRCGSATRISGANERDVYNQCSWTTYRFFLELFRCPTGDPKITSAGVEDLDLRFALNISGEGKLKPARGRKRIHG